MNTQTQEALRLIKIHDESGNIEDLVAAYNSCKEALEQPAQDYGDWFPIGLDAETGNCNHDRYAEGWNDCLNKCWEAYDRYKNCPIEQPAQEPVISFEQYQDLLYEYCKLKAKALEQPAQDFFERGKEIAKWADKQNEQPEPRIFLDLSNSNGNHPIEQPAQEHDAIIESLWSIIDDIDSYGDVAKSNDKLYRELVEQRQKDRWNTGITTDGYTLNISSHPASQPAKE